MFDLFCSHIICSCRHDFPTELREWNYEKVLCPFLNEYENNENMDQYTIYLNYY